MADQTINMGGSMQVQVIGTRRTKLTMLAAPGLMTAALVKSTYEATALVKAMTQKKLSNDVLNIRSGNLRRSIFRAIERRGPSPVGIVAVGTTAPYGRVHELGEGSMPERSFLRSSLAELESKIDRVYAREVGFVVATLNPFPGRIGGA